MDSYSRIKLNIKTANRFRKFSEQIAGSHSEALTLMMDFFDQNKISPSESLGPNMKTLENNLKGRINALIAIIKDIEKNQTKPTVAMLAALLEPATKKQPLMVEKKRTPLKDY
ncbi:MAG TPA: BfmA/BtgA family mobilization protein [Gillisia sp.]|nr:BfmA/BtgA family mobilization protein [Gillisia sp.]